MKLASRTNPLKQSDIRAVTALINQYNGINLGQGICDLPVPESIKEATKAAIDSDRSIYTPFAGVHELRTLIADKARSFNKLPVSGPENVQVTVGSTGAFVAAMMALFEQGDEVILFEPFYGYHRHLLELFGVVCRFVKIPDGDGPLPMAALEAAVTDKTKAILVCSPCNPSGKVFSRSELESILDLMKRRDLVALTDEIYEYIVYDGREHVSLGSMPGAWERTITISGFSKTFNMTGWRLGYAVGPEEVINKMGLISDLLVISAPAPLQHGMVGALPMADAYYTSMQADYLKKRDRFMRALDAAGFDSEPPQGAYYVLANFGDKLLQREDFQDAVSANHWLIKNVGVCGVPGHSFYQNPEDGRHRIRFCFAKEMHVLEEACRRMEKVS
jgi:aminotransferase